MLITKKQTGKKLVKTKVPIMLLTEKKSVRDRKLTELHTEKTSTKDKDFMMLLILMIEYNGIYLSIIEDIN